MPGVTQETLETGDHSCTAASGRPAPALNTPAVTPGDHRKHRGSVPPPPRCSIPSVTTLSISGNIPGRAPVAPRAVLPIRTSCRYRPGYRGTDLGKHRGRLSSLPRQVTRPVYALSILSGGRRHHLSSAASSRCQSWGSPDVTPSDPKQKWGPTSPSPRCGIPPIPAPSISGVTPGNTEDQCHHSHYVASVTVLLPVPTLSIP